MGDLRSVSAATALVTLACRSKPDGSVEDCNEHL